MPQSDNNQGEERVSIYATNVAPGDVDVNADSSGRLNVNVYSSLPAGGNLVGGTYLVDAAGTNKAAVDASGNVNVKFAAAQPITTDGTKITAATLGAGGVGAVGWLSQIANYLANAIAVTGTFWQANQPITTDGTKITAATLGAGGVGAIGWLSQIANAMGSALAAGNNVIGAVNSGAAALLSLNAATATGAGTAAAYTYSRQNFGLQVVLGGALAATACVVNLEGSNDGAHWFTLGTWNLAVQGSSGAMVFAYNAPVLNVRANLASFSGGTAPTFTATVSAV